MLGLGVAQLSEEGKDSLTDYSQELCNNKSELGCFYILFIFFSKYYLDCNNT